MKNIFYAYFYVHVLPIISQIIKEICYIHEKS